MFALIKQPGGFNLKHKRDNNPKTGRGTGGGEAGRFRPMKPPVERDTEARWTRVLPRGATEGSGFEKWRPKVLLKKKHEIKTRSCLSLPLIQDGE